jgi:hypothetical protein
MEVRGHLGAHGLALCGVGIPRKESADQVFSRTARTTTEVEIVLDALVMRLL